jgi:3-hydroxyacyl-CoA dehydrogenase
MKINQVTDLMVEAEIAVVTLDNPPVNALSAAARDGIYEGIGKAIDNPVVKAIVLMCAGPTFVAGGDIAALGTSQSGAPTREISRLIESSPEPVITAMHGSALGGGLEISLATHWRIATPSARCGLPEVKLGILPGAGGTQRLPRLIGVRNALEMIVFGEDVSALEALEMGIIDELVDEDDLRGGAIAFARKVLSEERPLRRARDAEETAVSRRANIKLVDDFAAEHAQVLRGALAPAACIRSIRAAFELPFEEGLDLERQLLGELIPSLQSKAMRSVFFAQRDIWKIPGVPRDTPQIPVRKVGVLAATPEGIADVHAFAAAGLSVVLFDSDLERLSRAVDVTNSVTKGRDPAILRDCDLVLDPTFGPLDAQRSVIATVAPFLRSDALVSTMALESVDDIVSPERLVGIHFLFPGDLRRFVEVVRTDRTAGPVVFTVMQLLKRMGKVAVLAKPDSLGVVTRMMRARQIAAESAVLEGAAMPARLDATLLEFGFPEGVFAWEDRVGLDVGWLRTREKGDALRAVLCEAGRGGRKTGAGFYDYDAAGHSEASPLTEAIVRRKLVASGVVADPLYGEALLQRLLFPIVNEGAKLLEAGLINRASDIDMMWVTNFGWPPYQGGPMFYGDSAVGLPMIVEHLRRWASKWGAAYGPCALLEQLATERKRFSDWKPVGADPAS